MKATMRIVAVLLVAIVAVITVQGLEIGERRVPLSVTSAFQLDTGDTGLTKQQIAKEISRQADAAGVAVALVSVPEGEYTEKRDLLTFGSAKPPGDHSRMWVLPARNAGVHSYDPTSAAPLDGDFAVWGGSITDQLQQWAGAHGIGVHEIQIETQRTRTAYAVLTNSAFVSVLAALLALCVLLVVRAAREVRGNTQKYLNGVSPWRIATEQVVKTTWLVLVPVVLASAVACGVVMWRSGPGFLPLYAEGIAHLLVPAVLGVAALTGLLSVVTRPTAAVIARRSVRGRVVLGFGEAVKVLSLALTLLLLPVVATDLVHAKQFAHEAEVWKSFSGVVSVNNFGGEPGSKEEAERDQQFRQLAASSAGTMLVYDMTRQLTQGAPGAQPFPGYGSVTVVNRAYLQRVAVDVDSLSPVDLTADPIAEQELVPTLQLQLGDKNASAERVYEVFQPMKLPADVALPVISNNYRDAMKMQRSSLVLLVDDVAALSPSFLGAITSGGGAMFESLAQLEGLLHEHGLAEHAKGINYVAVQGMLDLQGREVAAAHAGVALLVLGVTLLACMWLGARQYVLAHARRFLPLALCGNGPVRALRGRLEWELGVVLVLGAVAFVVARATEAPQSSVLVMCVGAVLAACCTALFHVYEFGVMVRRALLRKTL